MNHVEETLVIEHAGMRLEVPRDAALRAVLAKLGVVPAPFTAPRPLPLIGAQWQGGKYAGLTVVSNNPAELILLPGEFEGPWEKAAAWAKEQGGELPSRFDLLVLLTNLQAEFKQELYWSAEQCAGFGAYAWMQSFHYGFQYYALMVNDFRARAVRRVTIQ